MRGRIGLEAGTPRRRAGGSVPAEILGLRASTDVSVLARGFKPLGPRVARGSGAGASTPDLCPPRRCSGARAGNNHLWRAAVSGRGARESRRGAARVKNGRVSLGVSSRSRWVPRQYKAPRRGACGPRAPVPACREGPARPGPPPTREEGRGRKPEQGTREGRGSRGSSQARGSRPAAPARVPATPAASDAGPEAPLRPRPPAAAPCPAPRGLSPYRAAPTRARGPRPRLRPPRYLPPSPPPLPSTWLRFYRGLAAGASARSPLWAYNLCFSARPTRPSPSPPPGRPAHQARGDSPPRGLFVVVPPGRG